MLSPEVFTLAEYGDDPEIIHASDSNQLLHVLDVTYTTSSGTLTVTGC